MSLDWEYGIATFTEVVEGVIRLAIDRHGAEPSGRTLECISPLGLLSRPEDPLVGPDGVGSIGANCLFADDGGEGFALPTNEPRWISKIPELSKGATCLYSAKSFLMLDAENDAVSLLQPCQDADNVLSMNGKPGEETIQTIHVSGAKQSFLPDGSIMLMSSSGSAFIHLVGDEVIISGNVKIVGGVVLGEINSAVSLAKHEPYAAALLAVKAALTKLGTIGAGAPNSGAAAEITAAEAAVTAASTAGKALMVSGT